MKSALEETGNLISLFMHHVGESEVPDEYYLWSCISMIAACAGDRVWTQKFRTARIFPNMYTILVGASGSGKGQAIKTALRLIERVPLVHRYVGKTTGQHLTRYLSKKERRVMYLVNPELSADVGSGDVAQAFMKTMTKLWEGEDYGDIHEGTVTSGHVVVKSPCLNWIAGSTLDWLMHSVRPDEVHGGAFARISVIHATRDYEKRVPEITYPPDVEEVSEHLVARLHEITMLKGQFQKTAQAIEREHYWYMQRPKPDSPQMEATWSREHDMLLKFAMVASLADNSSLVIDKHHIAAGQKLAADASRNLPRVMQAAKITPDNEMAYKIADLIKRHGRITHSHLLRTTGATADQVRSAINTLLQGKQIMRSTTETGRGGTLYAWRGVRKVEVEEEQK
jgi:hypothetical protein